MITVSGTTKLRAHRELNRIVQLTLAVGWSALAVGAVGAADGATSAQAADIAAATPWVEKQNISKARMIAGQVRKPGAKVSPPQTYAGVELMVADGWKTYWRSSGDAAGVPPYFDFKGSSNVKQAKVLYPAPHRFSTPDGDSIGYKHKVIFPISLAPKDASKPMKLKLTMDYGVCSEICVPARAKFAVTIPAGGKLPILHAAPLVTALAKVPQFLGSSSAAVNSTSKTLPVLRSAIAKGLMGKKPRIIFDVEYPGGLQGADLFVEGPDEAFVPQPQKVGQPQGKRQRFAIDLTKGADLDELKGKPLRLTLVSAAGQSETTWLLKQQ